MKQIIEKVVDYYLTRNIKNRVILLLVGGGLYLVTQSIFGLVLNEWLKKEYGLEIPNFLYLGLILIFIGLVILIHEIKYSLVPSLFNTIKTTRAIYLGNNNYQFVFDKKMRCPPAICITKPNHKNNKIEVKHIDENGFFIQFQEGKLINEIQFWADAWDGLNIKQKIYIKMANLFRSKENKLEKREYENSFSQRQIEKINGA